MMVELMCASLWALLVSLVFNSHPLVLALLLVASGVILGFMLNYFLASWLMLALALIFLGGMMVIFLYFTSLISSEKLLTILSLPNLILPILVVQSNLLTSTSLSRETIPLFNFSVKTLWINLIMVGYLLLALLVAVELTASFKGALDTTN